MPKLRKTIKINAPPGKVWSLVGDLAGIVEWVSGIATVKIYGTKRVSVMTDGSEVHEEISDYSHESRSYSFEQTLVPFPVKNARGRIAVESDGDGSLVTLDMEFEPLNSSSEAELTRMLDGLYKQALESLRNCFRF